MKTNNRKIIILIILALIQAIHWYFQMFAQLITLNLMMIIVGIIYYTWLEHFQDYNEQQEG